MRKLLVIIIAAVLGTLSARGQHYDRGYDNSASGAFVKKGSWMLGGNAMYSQHSNKDFSFLLVEDINTTGYHVSASPVFCYMIADNMGLGLRASYKRGTLGVDSAQLSAMDVTLSVDDYFTLSQEYSVAGVFRGYIPLGNSKRFSMFAEMQLGGSLGQSKITNKTATGVKGTWEQSYKVMLGLNPGVTAFLTNHLALELNVGVMGISYSWMDQKHNQVYSGSRDSTSASFMVNFLSIGLGLAYYL